MNEKSIKIDDASFSEIKLLQNKFQELHGKFGNLGIEKMGLDRLVNEFIEKEKKLKEEWTSLQTLEQGLLDRIIKTHGTGNLNMADGTFTPTTPAPDAAPTK